ncbi:MAG: glycosyltransferase family 4 protein, partial [Chloroflexota bacterium]
TALPDRESAAVRERFGLDKPFILTVGTLEPRKNIVRLLEAFAAVRRTGLSTCLVHVGPRGWLYEEVYARVNQLELGNSVRFLGRVPIDDLVGLYNAAAVFAYPSLYEGFGLPPLEAMACGCPVVTSNTSSLPEVVGDAGLTVDPLSVPQLVDAISTVLVDRSLADDLRHRGLARGKTFSWERCARETVAVYRRAAKH